jgi:phosphopantetheinyl transferase (holo-ACP synthase)
MTEMTAQVAALIVNPGQVLTGLEQVRAHKWVRYEEEPVYLELRGQRLESPDGPRAWVGIFNRGTDGRADAPRPVFEAIAVFADKLPAPPPAAEWSLTDPRPSKFTASSVYDEQWLFHGPFFQAIARMGQLSGEGIEGSLRVLPLEPLIKAGQDPVFHTDLIVIDNFTQLLGAWGLDYLAEGDVMFPLRMDGLEIHGERPAVGTLVECRIHIGELERHRIRVHAEFIRPDGTVWMRINDWEDWRFHWPGRYRDSFRQPRDHMVGEELPLDGQMTNVKAVWLEPPADMGRPVWRDVLEYTQLGPDERAAYLATAGPDPRRSQRLWGRIAAKEAARRLWQAAGDPPVYPADLAIVADEHGRPCLTRVDGSSRVDRDPGFLSVAFTPGERTLIDQVPEPSRAEWIARFWCAKEAAAKASGLGLAGGPGSAEVVGFDAESGAVDVRLAAELAAMWSREIGANPVRVHSLRRGRHVWAWTIGTGA